MNFHPPTIEALDEGPLSSWTCSVDIPSEELFPDTGFADEQDRDIRFGNGVDTRQDISCRSTLRDESE
jgi:hypothetical protein